MSSIAIRSDLNGAGVSVSSRTIRKLSNVGIRGRIQRRNLRINLQQCKKKTTVGKGIHIWTDDQWSLIIWSNETKKSLFGIDGLKCPCMSANGIEHLHYIDEILDARKCIDNTLELKLLSSFRDLFPNHASFILHQDSASCYKAKLSKELFRKKSALNCCREWSGNCFDPNPVEDSNKMDLIETIIVSWHQVITKKELKTVVSSMKHRCEAVIKNKSYPIKY
ncbi:transposable element Tcb1 transposase [Trichonephila clavipes]|nr:transposable element Tcb1 transposase [Trichonephila clavipes]